MNPYLRILLAVALGLVLGIALAQLLIWLPHSLSTAVAIVLLVAVFVWNARELRWVRQQQRQMRREYKRFEQFMALQEWRAKQ